MGSAEHDGLVAVQHDAVFGVPFDGAGEHDVLDVTAQGGEGVDGHGVVDAFDVLFDDGAFVEFGGDVVGGGTDDLHTAVMGLVVGAGALEAGQEGVVDVDSAALELAADYEIGRASCRERV